MEDKQTKKTGSKRAGGSRGRWFGNWEDTAGKQAACQSRAAAAPGDHLLSESFYGPSLFRSTTPSASVPLKQQGGTLGFFPPSLSLSLSLSLSGCPNIWQPFVAAAEAGQRARAAAG